MKTVVVLSQDRIAERLLNDLKKFFRVSFIGEKKICVLNDAEVLLVETSKVSQVEAETGILVFKNCQYISNCTIDSIVTDSSELPLLRTDGAKVGQCITCGMSNKDTVSFSSIEENEVTVSLMRQIKDLYNRTIEPFEISVCLNSVEDVNNDFYALCLITIITLLGKIIPDNKLLI